MVFLKVNSVDNIKLLISHVKDEIYKYKNESEEFYKKNYEEFLANKHKFNKKKKIKIILYLILIFIFLYLTIELKFSSSLWVLYGILSLLVSLFF